MRLSDFTTLRRDSSRVAFAGRDRPIRDTHAGLDAGVVASEGKHASAHDLRRTTADRLVNAGVPPVDTQRIMRHPTITVTAQFYLATDAEKIAMRVAERFSSAYTIDTVAKEWPKRGSNPHDPYGSRDFKSRASANSAIRPEPKSILAQCHSHNSTGQ